MVTPYTRQAQFAAQAFTSRRQHSARMARFVLALAVVAALAVSQASAIYLPCDPNAAPVAPAKVSRRSDRTRVGVLHGASLTYPCAAQVRIESQKWNPSKGRVGECNPLAFLKQQLLHQHMPVTCMWPS
jgi:hypothetical protein